MKLVDHYPGEMKKCTLKTNNLNSTRFYKKLQKPKLLEVKTHYKFSSHAFFEKKQLYLANLTGSKSSRVTSS